MFLTLFFSSANFVGFGFDFLNVLLNTPRRLTLAAALSLNKMALKRRIGALFLFVITRLVAQRMQGNRVIQFNSLLYIKEG